ncbi:MAG: hypothetical protein VX278_00985 [Myxococcota bacterium]|nr:hypothetical protein [Myxococcota bacterium]
MLNLLFFLWTITGTALANEPNQAEQEAQGHLRNALTWYYLARYTENDSKAHSKAKDAYQKALDSLKNQPSSNAILLRNQAKIGLKQSDARIGNAQASFRNVMWPIWWITEADPTVEWFDDLYMKAAEIAFDRTNAQMAQLGAPTRVPVIVRASRNPNLPAKSLVDSSSLDERIAGLRDEFLRVADNEDYLYGIPDDIGIGLLGETWIKILEGLDLGPAEFSQLRTKLSNNRVFILDIEIVDEIAMSDDYPSIVRIQTRGRVFDTETGDPIEEITAQGIGQDIRSQNSYAVVWIAILFLTALATTLLRSHLLKKEEQENHPSWSSILGLATLAFIAGSLLGEFAGEISSEFLVEWGTSAFIREYTHFSIPYAPILIWPLVHGAVVMAGPLFFLAWASMKLESYINKFISDPKAHLPIIAPAVQAGATTWMFYPLVEAVPGRGLATALPLSLVAILISFVMAVPLASVLGGGVIRRNTLVALGLGSIALLQILPIGMYNNNVWLATGIAIGLVGAILWILGREMLVQTESELAEDSGSDDVILEVSAQIGSLEEPAWLDVTGNLNIVEQVQERRHLHINGISKYGATRTLNEIDAQLQKANKRPIRIVLSAPSETGAAPYTLINELYEQLGIGNLDLSKQEQLSQSLKENIMRTEEVLSMFPGFGLIVSSLSESGEDASVLRSRIIEDGAKVLKDALEKTNTQVVLVENFHWIDTSSLDVLKRYFEMCESPPSFIWNTTLRPGDHLDDFSDLVAKHHSLTRLDLPKLDLEHAKQFIQNAGIREFPDELVETLVSAAEGSVGGLHLLLILLKENKLLLPQQQDSLILYYPIENLTPNIIWAHLPKELQEQELNRFQHFNRETLFVLECAALCGSTFSIDELVAGVAMPRQTVLLKLEEIERMNPPIIEDIPSLDRHFRFVNNLTRIALNRRLSISGDIKRELAKSMHAGILNRNLSGEFLSPTQILHHSFPLGRVETQVENAAITLMRSYKHKCAWPEILTLYEQIQESLPQYENLHVQFEIQTIEAKALRFTGGQENRDRAQEILRNIIEQMGDNVVDVDESLLFDIFFTLFESQFEERDLEELNALHQMCIDYKPLVQSVLLRSLFLFYQHLSNSMLHRGTNIASELQDILNEMDTISPPCSREHDFLYAAVYQTYANKSWYEALSQTKLDPPPFTPEELWKDTVLPKMNRAMELKMALNDVQGMAMNYGIRGSIYLYNLREPTRALEAFEQDWKLVDENNLRSDKPGLLNKLGMTYQLLAEVTDVSENVKKEYIQKAQDLTHQAMSMAIEMEREVDFAFAFQEYLKLAVKEHEDKGLSEPMQSNLSALEAFVTDEAYWPKVPGFLKPNISAMLKELPAFPWTSDTLKILDSQ